MDISFLEILYSYNDKNMKIWEKLQSVFGVPTLFQTIFIYLFSRTKTGQMLAFKLQTSKFQPNYFVLA